MALAYGPNCGRVGWIPADVLRIVYDQPQYGSEIWTSLSSYAVPTPGFITWEAGENILICNWEVENWARQSGAGINLATGDFGCFYIRGVGLRPGKMMVEDCTAYLQGLKVCKEFDSESGESEEGQRKSKESFSRSPESEV